MKHSPLINAARLAEKAGRIGLASTLYSHSAKGLGDHRAEALYRLANLELEKSDPVDVRRMLEEAIELDPKRAPWHYRLATVLERQGDIEAASRHYKVAAELEPANSKWAERFKRCENTIRIAKAKADDERAKAFRRQGARWQELDVLLNSGDNYSNSPDWFARLGDSLEAMFRYREAAEAFERANSLRPGRPENLAREGYCWQKSGMRDRAQAAFRKAQESDKEHQSQSLGIGVFFERRGMWHEAAAHFEADCDDIPLVEELQFRAGRALERSYRWKESAFRYRQASLLNPSNPRNHFRLGYSLERMEDFAGAEDCYAYGLDVHPTAANYWSYRLGVVRQAQGLLELAIEAYSASLDVPATLVVEETDGASVSKSKNYELELLGEAKRLALQSSDPSYALAVTEEFERRGLWDEAASCLSAVLDRNQAFDSSIYFRLGNAYTNLGNHESAVEAFRMTRITVPPRGIDGSKYKNDATLQGYFEYTEMMETLPIRDNVIVYESFLGEQISCNPYALFQEIIADRKYQHFLHVWSVGPKTVIPKWMRHLDNVVFAHRGSHLNRRYLATAKYLVNNVTFPAYFVRREGQKYLNTWHGTPMKTLGKDVGTGVLEHKNVARNFLQSTHIVTPNDHTTRVLLERYDVESTATAKVAYTGYPRIDATLTADSDKRAELYKQLDIPVGDKRRIILYAPTWRGGGSFKHFDTERLVSDLRILADLDCVVLFQGHHLSVSLLPDSLPVRVVSTEVNTNELLAVVDILITDYSSILYDFLPTRRPVICYTYDLDEYAAERGLYFTPDELGLTEARSSKDLIRTVGAVLSAPTEYSVPESLVERFCAREDGQAAKRVKSFFLEEDDQWLVPRPSTEKRRYLFHHSLLPNGISSSLTNLLKSLDPDECDITIIVPAGVVEKNDDAISVLRGLPAHVNVIGDAGRQVVNIEEKWLIDYFNRWHLLPSAKQRELYMKAFRREYRRLLGDATFDVIVEFEGYSRYWTSVLATGRGKKVIYLHSDMDSERTTRLPYLQGVFELYENFDSLVSVSPALSELNKASVTKLVQIAPSKFLPIMNQIDPEGVLEGAAAPLDEDLSTWFDDQLPTLVSMGRLSLEKAQDKLLKALSSVFASGYRSNLVILGDGPQRKELERLASSLGLADYVYFAGHRENPFPALRAADCFVLPSNHEGQPMVLLESLMLGTPIIATDIPGSRQVLADNLGCIVENTVDGVAAGIIRVLEGKQSADLEFDAQKYRQEARDTFVAATEPNL